MSDKLNEFVMFLKNTHNLDVSEHLVSFKKESKKSRTLNIFTDGACKGNNGSRANGDVFGGIGIWSGYDDYNLNISEKHPNATNNKMELLAILKALDILETFENIQKTIIWSDSMYSIKCVTVWYKNWEKNGWKTSKGSDVENQDLIKPIIEKLKKYTEILEIKHVKGHSTSFGNNKADELATSALN